MPVSDTNRVLFTVVMCKDAPGAAAAEARERHMEAHLAYVESIVDQILIAGPMFGPDGRTVIGSLLVYKTDSEATARSFLEADPYFSAGIWDSIECQVFRGALGDAVGGKAY